MAHRRGRHGRGMRGPLALPNPFTGAPAPMRQHQSPAQFFTSCVTDAVQRVQRNAPTALVSIDVGIEDVPALESVARDRVPLAAAVAALPTRPGQIVLYRRPLERRARTRRGLRILVFRTLVEQVAALTGFNNTELDPDGYGSDDDWD